MKVLISMHLYMMQRGSPYITGQSLNRHPYNYIVQPLSSPQRKVLFEKHLRSISPLGFKQSPKYKHIGTRRYRRSRATRAQSDQSPSRRTGSRSSRAQTIRRSGSGTLLQEYYYRRSRATRTRLTQLLSRRTGRKSSRALTIKRFGSGTLLQEHCYRGSRAIWDMSAQ